MTTDDVWNYIGGWLNDSYVSGDANYINNCALRLSIALSSYGIDLNGAPGANNIGAKGNSLALGVKAHYHQRSSNGGLSPYPAGDS